MLKNLYKNKICNRLSRDKFNNFGERGILRGKPQVVSLKY